jgi:hypothetical protein
MFYTYEYLFGSGRSFPWKPDPGPCPVDDAPHTTCTSADYQPPLIIPQLPMKDAMTAAAAPSSPQPPRTPLPVRMRVRRRPK